MNPISYGSTKTMHFIAFRSRSALLLALALAAVGSPTGALGSSEKNEDCLACHEFDDGDVISFKDGTERSVAFDVDSYAGSVHGDSVSCTDCHQGITDYPHPPIEEETARGYSLARGESCKSCHYAYYTRMLDGIHYKMLSEGNQEAPTCIDCHGHHEIAVASRPRDAIAGRCGTCHADVAEVYAASVHGRGISGEQAADYPTCTDCHGAHSIKDPGGHEFHASAHEICAPCHSDSARMARYDLNPNVVSTYLDDFHGRSNVIYQSSNGAPVQTMANCTDCHGFHDVRSFRGEGSVAEVRERVVETCRKCHEDATPAFADSWLSHYEPSLKSAPLVWSVKWGYRFLVPFIMMALVVHIGLHLRQAHRRRPAAPLGSGEPK